MLILSTIVCDATIIQFNWYKNPIAIIDFTLYLIRFFDIKNVPEENCFSLMKFGEIYKEIYINSPLYGTVIKYKIL